MKRFFLGFLLLFLIFLTLGKGIVMGLLIEEVGKEILEEGKEQVGIRTDDKQKKNAKDITTENKKKAEEILQNQSDSKDCDEIGEKCCQVLFTELPKTPDLSWIDIDTKGLNSQIDKTNQQLPSNPVLFCVNGFPDNPNDPNSCKCIKEELDLKKMCDKITKGAEQTACRNCSNHGVWTALGCIDFSLEGFIKNTLLGWGIGLAGVVSLLCIIYSAFMMQISGGNPEKLKRTRERLNSCIIGLILIIFSVFILRVIGVDILQIPGFK